MKLLALRRCGNAIKDIFTAPRDVAEQLKSIRTHLVCSSEQGGKLKKENDQLSSENDQLSHDKQSLKWAVNRLKAENKMLGARNSELTFVIILGSFVWFFIGVFIR